MSCSNCDICAVCGLENKSLIKHEKELKDGLDKILSLTRSWVIAEHTIDCKHTYPEIRLAIYQLKRDLGID